ncbi:Os03g0730100, partial [Oryza sativa Japonica Group]
AEGGGGAEVGDPGLDAGSVAVVVGDGVVEEGHPVGEAPGERRHDDGRVEPEAEPPAAAAHHGPHAAREARRGVLLRQPRLQLVPAGAGDQDHRLRVGGGEGRRGAERGWRGEERRAGSPVGRRPRGSRRRSPSRRRRPA